MPYARPTLTQLRAQAASDINAALPGADASLLRFSNLGILGRVLARMVNGFYGYLDWIARQATPFTATGEFLEAWAALKGVFRLQPTLAIGSASFPGTAGDPLPAGTSVVRGDGVAFVTTAAATVGVGGTVSAPIAAAVPGSAANTAAGAPLTLGSAVPGVMSGGTASGPLTGGADLETDDALRTRMLQAFAAPGQGGDETDYIEWATAVAGVTRAWVKPCGFGAGTVIVYVMFDVAEAAFGGFPQGASGVASTETRSPLIAAGDQLAVANSILKLQPVTALVFVVAPLANQVNFTIAGTAGWSLATQAAVSAAIVGVFLQQGSVGGVILPNGLAGGTVDVSYIETAIAAVPGTAGFVITAIAPFNGVASPGPAGNITANPGYLSVLGAITWAP